MKALLAVILAAIFFNAFPLLANDRVYDLATDVTYQEKGGLYLDKDGTPITGIVVWSHKDYRRETPVESGKKNGIDRAYIRGKLLTERLFINNKLSGNYRFFDFDGRLKSERKYADIALKAPGWEREYNAKGQIIWECAEDLTNRPNGCNRYEYHSNGVLKSISPAIIKKTDKRTSLIFNDQGRLITK